MERSGNGGLLAVETGEGGVEKWESTRQTPEHATYRGGDPVTTWQNTEACWQNEQICAPAGAGLVREVDPQRKSTSLA